MQSFNGSCATDAACNPFQNLFCNVAQENPNTCQCLPYNYWNSSSKTCLAQKANIGSCSSPNECLSFSGLYCNATCQCSSSCYWSDPLKFCVKKASYGEQCSATPHDSTLNLVCDGSYAVCPTSTFWNGSNCGEFFSLLFVILVINRFSVAG